jgi:hypothetical protein
MTSSSPPNIPSGKVDELESARQINGYLNHYVTVTDAKAIGLIAGVFASAAFLLKDIPCSASGFFWVYCAAALFHAVAASLGLAAIYPRVPSMGTSVIFWEDINLRKSLGDYLKAYKATCSSGFLDEEYATQNYYVGKVLHRKTALVRWSIRVFVLALVAGLVVYAVTPHPK